MTNNTPNPSGTTGAAVSTLAAPRDGTKQVQLVSILSRKSGSILTKASEALGWQRHTTSAALTGLRKRGYSIEREDRKNKDAVYRITAPAAVSCRYALKGWQAQTAQFWPPHGQRP